MVEHAADRALPPARHEGPDIGLRFMLGLLGLIGGILLFLLWLASTLFHDTLRDNRFAQPFPNYPAPRLQPSPPVDMQHFYADEMKRLNTAGWTDQQAGVVHMPIAQAMRAVAAEGIAGWPPAKAPKP